MQTIVIYETKGGKFKKELRQNNDKTFNIVDFTHEYKTSNNFLGLVSLEDAIKQIEKEVHLAETYDNKNFIKGRFPINAAILEDIERVIYAKNFKPNKTTTKVLYNGDSKEDFVKAFSECVSFEIYEDSVEFEFYRSEQDLISQIEKNDVYLKNNINTLRKRCTTSDKYLWQIHTYLNRNNLEYILKLL